MGTATTKKKRRSDALFTQKKTTEVTWYPSLDKQSIENLRQFANSGETGKIPATVSFTRGGKCRVTIADEAIRSINEAARRLRKHNGSASVKDPMANIGADDQFPIVKHDYSDVNAEVKNGLTPSEICERMGVSRTTLSNYRDNLNLLGLPKGTRSFVFPAWQLDASGQPITEIRTILKLLDPIAPKPVDKVIQLLAKSEFYGGKSIKDFLCEGYVERAVEATEKRLML